MNKKVFASQSLDEKVRTPKEGPRPVEATDSINYAGGKAYLFPDQHALAQMAATGTFNDGYYTHAQDQTHKFIEYSNRVDDQFLAKCAVCTREQFFMKDSAAVMLAALCMRNKALARRIFPRVADNGKMMRNVVQTFLSGVLGRTHPPKIVRKEFTKWIQQQDPVSTMRAYVGNSPALRDMLRLFHPRPLNQEQRALWGWITHQDGMNDELKAYLPSLILEYEAFKRGELETPPNVPFQLLTSFNLTKAQWKAIVMRGGWHFLRMNINTFARNGLLQDKEVVRHISDTLRDPEIIRKARVFPYQIMSTYTAIHDLRTSYDDAFVLRRTLVSRDDIPKDISSALQDALDISLDNVPIPQGGGMLAVLVDVSGSMGQPVTGYRRGASSQVLCVDVAALVASVYLKKYENTVVIPVDTECHSTESLNPRDSIMTNAQKLSSFGGGGTELSKAMQYLDAKYAKEPIEAVIMVSDNESWMETFGASLWRSEATKFMGLWNRIKNRNPAAKLVCIDITANETTQAHERTDVLNVGGFSDRVFEIIDLFLKDELNSNHWVELIERTEL